MLKVSARLAALLAALLALALTGVPASAGTMKQFRYHSAALGGEQIAEVYVPSAGPPASGWPVLYLLHGLHGAPTDWELLGGIRPLLDRLIDEKRIKPMLVVMPDGENSWYVDSADIGGPGNYASAIGRDLPAAVEAAFPVGTDRMHRAIGGLSMGGYGALRLGLASPERFGAVAALSPAIWQNIPVQQAGAPGPDTHRPPSPSYFQRFDPATVTIGVDLPPDGSHFGGAFGTPFDPKRFDAANVFTLLERAIEAKQALPAIFLSVGDDDSHLLWRGSIAFFETMQMNKRWMEFRVTDGNHDWTLWRQTLCDALLFVDAHLSKAPVR